MEDVLTNQQVSVARNPPKRTDLPNEISVERDSHFGFRIATVYAELLFSFFNNLLCQTDSVWAQTPPGWSIPQDPRAEYVASQLSNGPRGHEYCQQRNCQQDSGAVS